VSLASDLMALSSLPWRTLVGFLAGVGRAARDAARHAGGMSILVFRVGEAIVRGRVSAQDVVSQLYTVGVRSVPLVCATAILSGVVTSQQGGYQLTTTVPLYVLGSVVAASVVLELGPVMTAFVVIGRVGARITAEIGTMKVSEQIDALYALSRDPVSVLAAPRIVAGLVAMPLLVGIADLVGIVAGMIAAGAAVGLGQNAFFYGARMYWHDWDLVYSLSKGLVFGFVIPLISTHMGFETRGGAEGVGRATTLAVVTMIVSTLVLDAVFPPLFLN
jgi:phospholipid/cholesterol/gamma-HCH transport system permease protein